MHPYLRRHLRGLLKALIPGAAVVIGGAIAGLGPWSPLALDRADALASAGRIDDACAAYRSVARYGATVDLREEAAWRAAVAMSLEAGPQGDTQEGPQGAIRGLRAYTRAYPNGRWRGEAFARLGALYAGHLNAWERAGRAWRQAARVDPGHDDAPDWTLRAADAFERAGLDARAHALRLSVARAWPDRGPEANLEAARGLLRAGRAVQAYALYQQVAASEAPDEVRAMGRLGMSICLERSGDLSAALAELDEAVSLSSGAGPGALPEDLWRLRRDRVQERLTAKAAQATARPRIAKGTRTPAPPGRPPRARR